VTGGRRRPNAALTAAGPRATTVGMMRTALAMTLVAVLATACGGKDEAAVGTTPTPTGPIKSPSSTGVAAIPPELDVFHTALAIRWHSVGTTRMHDTCGAMGDLRTKLTALRGAGVPGDLDESAWNAATTKVENALAGVKSRCGGSDSTKFEAAFTDLHLAFHEYMDLVVGDHGHGTGDGRGGRRGIPK